MTDSLGLAQRQQADQLFPSFAPGQRLAQRLQLFAQPAKDRRIARLQAHHRVAFPGVLDHEGIDLFLADASLSAALAHVDELRGPRAEAKDVRRHQVVV